MKVLKALIITAAVLLILVNISILSAHIQGNLHPNLTALIIIDAVAIVLLSIYTWLFQEIKAVKKLENKYK